MSLLLTQKRCRYDHATKAFLVSGVAPDTLTVQEAIEERGHQEGKPALAPMRVLSDTAADKAAYVSLFENIQEDLDILTQVTWSAYDRLVSLAEASASRIDGLGTALSSLESEHAGISDMSDAGYTGLLRACANNFYDLDFAQDAACGLSGTDAVIDSSRRFAHLPYRTHRPDRVAYEGQVVTETPLTDYVSKSFRGEVSAIARDASNNSYRCLYGSSQSSFMVEILIGLPGPVDCNGVSFRYKSASHLSVVMERSGDGVVYTPSPLRLSPDYLEWAFDRTPVTSVRFTFAKTAPDYTQDGVNYFEFVFNHAAFYDHVYKEKAVLTSQAMPSDVLFKEGLLYVDDYVPSSTGIRYYISTTIPGVDVQRWKEVKNGETFQTGLAKDAVVFVNSPDGSASAQTSPMGTVWRVVRIPDNAVKDTFRIWGGYRQWRLSRYGFDPVLAFLPAAYEGLAADGVSVVDEVNGQTDLTKNKAYLFRQVIECTEAVSGISLRLDGFNLVHLSVDGEAVLASESVYLFDLSAGSHEIKILCAYQDDAEAGLPEQDLLSYAYTENGMTFSSRFAFGEMSRKDYAALAGTPVGQSLGHYTVLGYFACVGYDPTVFGVNDRGVSYKITYRQKMIDAPDTCSVRLMAVMTSSDSDMTPQLTGWRILTR